MKPLTDLELILERIEAYEPVFDDDGLLEAQDQVSRVKQGQAGSSSNSKFGTS